MNAFCKVGYSGTESSGYVAPTNGHFHTLLHCSDGSDDDTSKVESAVHVSPKGAPFSGRTSPNRQLPLEPVEPVLIGTSLTAISRSDRN